MHELQQKITPSKVHETRSLCFQVDLEGGLLGRCFDVWEALAQSSAAERGFEVLLQVLPEAMDRWRWMGGSDGSLW